jgi:hypothetical protein
MAQIVYNALQTPDGTIIVSQHRHDYVVHEDKNGKHYMVDGGTDYLRRSVNDDQKDLSLYLHDDYSKIREVFVWGRNYDENMKRLPKTEWVALKDLNLGHLDALCLYDAAGWWRRVLFLKEKQYRNLVLENIPDQI